MKRMFASIAAAAAIMSAGPAAFAAGGEHTAHAAAAETVTINKFVYGPYLIIVRYQKGDPLPKRFNVPMTLRQGAEQNTTMTEVASLQRKYMALARGSIQVFMLNPVDPKVIKHVQRRRCLHAHVNTGFGGEARLVAHNFPAGYRVRK
jgi:hypothetical protein